MTNDEAEVDQRLTKEKSNEKSEQTISGDKTTPSNTSLKWQCESCKLVKIILLLFFIIIIL